MSQTHTPTLTLLTTMLLAAVSSPLASPRSKQLIRETEASGHFRSKGGRRADRSTSISMKAPGCRST
ncbi:MAG: hypothetical protein HN899_06450 [Gemmatimonadales bacterium]|nr:hypothetical protein [Gemmatimonadales bacterium]